MIYCQGFQEFNWETVQVTWDWRKGAQISFEREYTLKAAFSSSLLVWLQQMTKTHKASNTMFSVYLFSLALTKNADLPVGTQNNSLLFKGKGFLAVSSNSSFKFLFPPPFFLTYFQEHLTAYHQLYMGGKKGMIRWSVCLPPAHGDLLQVVTLAIDNRKYRVCLLEQ